MLLFLRREATGSLLPTPFFSSSFRPSPSPLLSGHASHDRYLGSPNDSRADLSATFNVASEASCYGLPLASCISSGQYFVQGASLRRDWTRQGSIRIVTVRLCATQRCRRQRRWSIAIYSREDHGSFLKSSTDYTYVEALQCVQI